MIFRYLAVITESPLAFVILIAAFTASLLVGLVFHEVAHAYVADSLGDKTPRRHGRLSLNPLRHLDPLGSALIFIVGFGWAKPVPIGPSSGRETALIALAGPATNLVVAFLAGLAIKLQFVPFFHPFVPPSAADYWARVWTDSPDHLIGLFLGTVVLLNVILAVFNLIPLAPLDGFRVALGVLPEHLARPVARLEPWMPGALLVLILLPFIGGPSLLFDVMGPAIEFLLRVFVESADLRVV